MRARARHDETVEDLMTRAPHVELPGTPPPLGHPCRVDARAHHVEQPLRHEPVEGDALAEGRQAVAPRAVGDGEQRGEAHGEEDGGADGAVGGCFEAGVQRRGEADEGEGGDEGGVGVAEGRVAGEAVVEAGHEGAPDEEGDAGVVERVEGGGYAWRVVGEGVVGGGDGEAEEGGEVEGREGEVRVVVEMVEVEQGAEQVGVDVECFIV